MHRKSNTSHVKIIIQNLTPLPPHAVMKHPHKNAPAQKNPVVPDKATETKTSSRLSEHAPARCISPIHR
ncbi:hypothetical protein TNCV_4872031 [Trichonephila clavipes]|nr:hypothetical protein TNCV_4872031 [Trichonephila clavipes]